MDTQEPQKLARAELNAVMATLGKLYDLSEESSPKWATAAAHAADIVKEFPELANAELLDQARDAGAKLRSRQLFWGDQARDGCLDRTDPYSRKNLQEFSLPKLESATDDFENFLTLPIAIYNARPDLRLEDLKKNKELDAALRVLDKMGENAPLNEGCSDALLKVAMRNHDYHDDAVKLLLRDLNKKTDRIDPVIEACRNEIEIKRLRENIDTDSPEATERLALFTLGKIYECFPEHVSRKDAEFLRRIVFAPENDTLRSRMNDSTLR